MYVLTECQQLPCYHTFISCSTWEEPIDFYLISTVLTVVMCVSWVAQVATSRKVSRTVSLGRMRDEDVNSLSDIMWGRASTYRSRLPAESQNR